MHADEIEVDAALVDCLIAAQFPDLAGQRVEVLEPWGTDNAVWRLGDELVVRLPRIGWAVEQVHRDAVWLPRLAPHLPVAVPDPIAIGAPGCGYLYVWAVHRWIPGEAATPARIDDPFRFAEDLARVVLALWSTPTAGAPPARNRARPLGDYDRDARDAIRSAGHLIDVDAATAVWEEALAAPAHRGSPVWVHGDLEGNCLVDNGQLCGLIDWGSACAGDPAVDVQVGWSPLFTADSRQVFFNVLAVDDATIARSRGAAVHQACAALSYYLDTYPLIVERSWHKLAALGIGQAGT